MGITQNTITLTSAAKAAGRSGRTAQRNAALLGKLFDIRGLKGGGESIPTTAVLNEETGDVVAYTVRSADLDRLRHLLFIDKEAPAVSKPQSRQTRGLSVYTDGNPWAAIGEVEALERLAVEQPDLLTVNLVAPNRALISTERPEELREALDASWTS